MRIHDAFDIAERWVRSSSAGFQSAFIGGSTGMANPQGHLDSASDVDVYVIAEQASTSEKIGKIRIEGVLLDVTPLNQAEFEQSIAADDAVMCSLLNFGRIIVDDGTLGALQQSTRDSFDSPDRIMARLSDMRTRITRGLSHDSSRLPEAEQVMNWLFPATLVTHIPLIQACAPLTVRKRFEAASRVMTPATYEELLSLFGWGTLQPATVRAWLEFAAELMEQTIDTARESRRFWAGDITPDARPIAIDGTRHLLDQGFHREAVYWIVATAARCLVVRSDAQIESVDWQHDFNQMLSGLGIETADQRRAVTGRIFDWIM